MIIDVLISSCLRKEHNYSALSWHNEFIEMGGVGLAVSLNKKQNKTWLMFWYCMSFYLSWAWTEHIFE